MFELGRRMRQRQRHGHATGEPHAPLDRHPLEARRDQKGDAGAFEVGAAVEEVEGHAPGGGVEHAIADLAVDVVMDGDPLAVAAGVVEEG